MNPLQAEPAIPCVICQGDSVLLLQKNSIPIQQCTVCNHVFAHLESSEDHVNNVYGQEYFFGGKDGYPNYLEEGPLLEKSGQHYARLIRKHTVPGDLLDIGAAAGFIMKGFAHEGWRCKGLEPNQEMARHGREKLGLDIAPGVLETCNFDQQFDLATMIQVIAHLHDLTGALENLEKLVRPGGALLVETWNQESLTARAFGKHWHEYSPPSVLHWFTPDRLSSLLQGYGFSQVAKGRRLKWISLGHASSLLRHAFGKNTSPGIGGKTAGSGSVSIPYPSEDLFWSLYVKE